MEALSRVRSLDSLQTDELDCSKLTGIQPYNNDALAEIAVLAKSSPGIFLGVKDFAKRFNNIPIRVVHV